MKKKYLQIFTIIFFCAFILVMDAFTIANKDKTYSELEKRKLAKKPKFSASRVLKGQFQDDFVDYLSDHFAFRDTWVNVKSNVDLSLGEKEVDDVYIGKDGYLIEKYTDEDFDKDQIKTNIKYLKNIVNMASENLGTKHVKIILVPGKETVLSDKLPMFVELPTMQEYMEKRLCDKVNDSENVVINLKEPLKKHSDEYIYYRTDHHWTSLGAKYAYEEIMKSLGKKGTDGQAAGEEGDSDTSSPDEDKKDKDS
ncbi:MAG: hypothetical protein K6G11_09510, partial [Lachnospiraceae bacterium]|nr:hypothetical protein [Lachnospiraceae bacterium]